MKNRNVALRMMIALFLLMVLPSEVTAASVLSGVEIVSGERGTILFLKSNNAIDCKISNSSETVTILLPGCIYGLKDFSYTKFDKKSPVSSLVASEKKNSAIVQLQITMKDPLDETPVVKRKNSDIYVLLSKKSGDSYTWKAQTAFDESNKSAMTGTIKQPDNTSTAAASQGNVIKSEDNTVTTLTDISMVYREQICRINFQFNGSVAGAIVRSRDSVVCSFKGVKNGLERSVYDIHPRSAYKKIIISEKKGIENVLIAKIVVDTSEFMGRTSIVFEDSMHFTVMAINKSSYNAFWSAQSGSSWEHELTYIKPYEIDLKKMGERAEKDVALNLSNGPVFRVGEFFSEPPSVETVQNEIPAVDPEKLSETTPEVDSNKPENEQASQAPVVSRLKPEEYDTVLINADDVNVRKQPSVTSVAITKVMKGMHAQRIASDNGWTRIAVNGKSGWINNKFVQEPSPLAITAPEKLNVEAAAAGAKMEEGSELKPRVHTISNDSIAIQKVSQQIGEEEIFRDDRSEPDNVIRYHQKGRDPFEPVLRDSLILRGKASIDQLQLVGVLIDGNNKVALLEDKSTKKQAFTLRENDAVENGKVLKVFPDRVVFLLTEFGISRSFTLRLKGINTDEEARFR